MAETEENIEHVAVNYVEEEIDVVDVGLKIDNWAIHDMAMHTKILHEIISKLWN